MAGFSFGGAKAPKVIIGVDTVSQCVKVMRIPAGGTKEATVEYLPYQSRPMDREFFANFERLISDHLSAYPSTQSTAVYAVLPDSAVACDVITVPSVKKSRMQNALNVEIENQYKNHLDLSIRSYIAAANKQYTLYRLTMVRKELLSSFYKSLAACKLFAKETTYAANAAVDAVLALRPKNRMHSFIFVDIREKSTLFAFVNKGRTIGFHTFPFGYSAVLEATKVVHEGTLYHHDVAELAVLNAREKARAKQMTQMFDPDAVSLDEVADMAEALPPAPPEFAEEFSAEQPDGLAEAAAADGEENVPSSSVEAVEDEAPPASAALESESAANVSVPVKEPPRPKIFSRKMPKRLPKFMQRPVPETQEEMAVENFRIFLKYILLYKQFQEFDEYYQTPEYALVNMPEEFGYIIERINESQEESGIELRYFEPQHEGNPNVTLNLDLFGGLFLKNFNKNQNF